MSSPSNIVTVIDRMESTINPSVPGSKPFSEIPESNHPCGRVDLVHHVGDKVCNIEMLPTRKRKVRNVMTRMKDDKIRGPLGVLQRYMTENIKVKVLTRNYKHVRGICTGFILAFDKHWNLALKEVDEVYKNPVPRAALKKLKRLKVKQQKKKLKDVPLDVEFSVSTSKPDEETGSSPAKQNAVIGHLSSSSEDKNCEDNLSGHVELSELKSLTQERECIMKQLQALSSIQSADAEERETNTGQCSVAYSTQDVFSLDHKSKTRRSSVKESVELKSRKSYPEEPSTCRQSRGNRSHTSSDDRNSGIRSTNIRSQKQSLNHPDNVKSDNSFIKTGCCLSRQRRQEKPHFSRDVEMDIPTDVSSAKRLERNFVLPSQSEKYQPWLERHVSQLFIRGDNVVLVSPMGD